MNKKIKVTSVAAAALASLVIANANVNNEVKADTTKPATDTTAKAQTPEEAAKANVASAQKKVDEETSNFDKAKGDLDQAKHDAVKSDTDYKTQSDKVDELKKTTDQKNADLTDAKSKVKDAQDLANEAKDPAKVQAANDAVAKQEDTVANANKAKDDADKAVSDKQAEISKDNGDIQANTQNVKDKTTEKENAQKALTDAINALNGTGLKEANQKVNEAKQAQTDANKQLTENRKYMQDLQIKKSQLEAKIQKQQAQLADDGQLKKTASEAKQAHDSAVKKLAQLNQQIQAKQKEIQNLQDQLKDFDNLNNTIDIGDVNSYKKAYADNNQNNWHGELTDADMVYLNQTRAKNKYQHSEEDKNIKVDPSNLNDAQITELSRFVADIVNKVRKEMGLSGKVEVTTGAENFAKQLAQGYEAGFKAGDWHSADGHYVKKINEIAQQMGLKYDKNNTQQFYEDKGTHQYFSYEDTWDSETGLKVIVDDGMPKNMDELKERVYNCMLGMILPDGNGVVDSSNDKIYEFGHARGLLVLPNSFTNSKQDNEKRKNALEPKIANDKEQVSSFKHEVEVAKEQHLPVLAGLEGSLGDRQNTLTQDQTELADVSQSLGIEDNAPIYQVGAATSKFVDMSRKLDDGNLYDEPTLQMHFITVRPESIEDAQKYNSEPLPTADAINEKIDQDNEDINQKLVPQKNAIDEQGLKAALDKANKPVSDAEQTLTRSQQDKNKLEKLIKAQQSRIDNLQTSLASDGKIAKDLASAQAELARLTASHEDKQKAYDEANKKLDEASQSLEAAKIQLKNKQTDLKKDQEKLANLEEEASDKAKDVETETTKLANAKQHVEDLKNAATILNDAKKAETSAQNAYATAKKNLDDAQALLNGDLKTKKDQANAKVVAAQKAYDEAAAKLQAAKNALNKAKQALQDILDAENAQYIVSDATENKNQEKQETAKTPEATPTTKTKVLNAPKKVRLTHNAFVYDKHGKVVKSGLHIKLIKRGKVVKALKHAKIVKIKGKRYYQIGHNKFVKVANFELTTHKVHFKAMIKGNKSIKMFDRSGKFNKHYAHAHVFYSFNEKAKINGKTYYKIAGTNNWIPAKKLALKK